MDEAAATARLRAMTDSDTEPRLTVDDLAMLLEDARLADAQGRAPGDDGYVPSWHLPAAAAAGWRLKAGRVAGKVDASADGGSLKRSQAHAHCLAMARLYAAQGVGSIVLSGARPADAVQVGVVNAPEPDDLYPGRLPSRGWPGGATR